MPDGDPAQFGRWRNADPTDPNLDTRPTRTPGSGKAVANPDGTPTFVPDNLGVFAVHMALMRTGRVLMFSGRSEGDQFIHRSWSWDPTQAPATASGRWVAEGYPDDPPWTVVPGRNEDPDSDVFCAHHVFLSDGRLVVVGGDHYPGDPAVPSDNHTNASVHIYDPETEDWTRLPDQMQYGRWYPTAVLLPDGSVLVFSGLSDSPGAGSIDRTVEHLRPPSYVPRPVLGGERLVGGSPRGLQSYPSLHLVRGGSVFYTFASWGYGGSTAGMEAARIAQIRDRLGDTSSFKMRPQALWTDADVPEGQWDYHGVAPTEKLREEGTVVLLPPAQDGRILVIGGGWWDRTASPDKQQGTPKSCEILDTNTDPPTWSSAGDMHHPRVNANAVLLPDGKVLIFGGHDKHKRNHDGTHPANEAEIYDPTVEPTVADPSAPFTQVAVVRATRMYHATGVLLPDATVLVAGGEENAHPTFGFGVDQRSMEVYEPPYCHQGARPAITSITDTGGPDDQIHFGGRFTLQTTQAANVDKVVLMRPGATTHHTDSDQRYVPLSFNTGSGQLVVEVPNDPSIAPPGYYMVFIVDNQGLPCERASFVRLSHEHCTLFTDKSHYSSDEYAALTVGGAVAEFEHALYVVIHGFIPSEVGIATTTPNAGQLSAYAPGITFSDGAGNTVSSLQAIPTAMHLEVPGGGTLDVRQRITFGYAIRFTNSNMFPAEGALPDTRTIELSSSYRGYTCTGEIVLTRRPNPFMLDGPKHWLSVDVRVFHVRSGDSAPGLPSRVISATSPDPNAFVAGLLDDYNNLPASSGHPFNSLATDQQDSRLHLAQQVDGRNAYNFAVAQVRYRGLALTAGDVRVFFRMFTTAATSLEFRPDTYTTRTVGGRVLADLGQNATDVLSIPFFAGSRDTLDSVGDPKNVQTLAPGAGGAEVHHYYGAWLDFNQTTPRYVDPEDAVLKSIQELIRGQHQCLVAEINYDQDPIAVGATPANNDNLSQRNLAIVPSDNPGGLASHKIVHTFDVRPTLFAEMHGRGEAIHAIGPVPDEPDELMIVWGNLPRDSVVTIYLPELDADEIVALSSRDYGPTRLERVDANTVRCVVADVTYVPLPARSPRNISGLLTIQLPESLKRGQEFRVEIRQVSNIQERVVGTFELLIPVSTSDLLLADEMRTLSVMKHIGTKIGPDSRWYPVFQRYLEGLGDRVRGFGGDPTRVDASPRGDGGSGSIRPGGGGPGDGSADLLDECVHLLARYARLGLLALLALVIVVVAVLVVLLTT